MVGYWINLSGISYLSRSDHLVMGDITTDGKARKNVTDGMNIPSGQPAREGRIKNKICLCIKK
jgi:hypothetical protein